MAEAFSDPPRISYKYQYSVIPALHGTDVTAYFGPASPQQGPDFTKAFMRTQSYHTFLLNQCLPLTDIVGNFVTANNPSITAAIANGASAKKSGTANPATDWPPYEIYAPYQIDLNQTGGTEISFATGIGTSNSTIYVEPGLANNFSLVNAYTWEGGRGYRCDFWRSVGSIVPE